MADQIERPADDAPPASATHSAARHDAIDALIDGQGSEITSRAVTINKPVDEVYRRFRDFSRLPEFMDNVVRIDEFDDGRSHWVVKAPGGRTVEWDARLTADEPGRLIAWTSEKGADVANSGQVEFRDAGARGTVVVATIAYDPPGGAIGKIIAKMFQREPAIQARRDLRRFKQLLETGEVATAARTRQELEEEQD